MLILGINTMLFPISETILIKVFSERKETSLKYVFTHIPYVTRINNITNLMYYNKQKKKHHLMKILNGVYINLFICPSTHPSVS